ncbi:MAG: anthranilate phosphoribosyltransferase [Caulobacterales bacterium]
MSALDGEFAAILDGQTSLEETKTFLTRSVEFMGDAEALAVGARAMRSRMVRVKAPDGAIDVCGTGGDGAHTLNVSTAVTFVVAGAGVPVAKHGNRAMSSKSGAADVLEALGVKLTGDVPTLERCLADAKVAFLFAQNHHPSMRHVAQARRELGFRTIFNLLGPLSNPAGVSRQLLGVFASEFVEPVARALRLLGAERAWVIHGHGGIDELSVVGDNEIAMLNGASIQHHDMNAGDMLLSPHDPDDLKGGSAAENAEALLALLDGKKSGSLYDEIVQLNAGAALVVAGRASTIDEGGQLAAASLHDGRARAALDKLIALTKDAP